MNGLKRKTRSGLGQNVRYLNALFFCQITFEENSLLKVRLEGFADGLSDVILWTAREHFEASVLKTSNRDFEDQSFSA